MSKVVALRPDSSVAPNLLNGKVPPPRVPNAERRTREYLTDDEVEALMTAARKVGRHGHRDDLPPGPIPGQLRESEVIVSS